MKRLLLSLVAVAAIAFAGAGPALANTLHQTPPIVGTQFDGQDCSDGLGTGWVFVNTGSHDETGAVLTATFADAGTVQVNGYTPGNGVVHYFVPVSTSDTLLSASDSLSTDGKLNLSHVCTEEVSPSPSPSPSIAPSPSPSEEASPSPSVEPSPSPSPEVSPSPSPTPKVSPSSSPIPTLAPSPRPSVMPTPPSTSVDLVAYPGPDTTTLIVWIILGVLGVLGAVDLILLYLRHRKR